jgi:hypothetical protein
VARCCSPSARLCDVTVCRNTVELPHHHFRKKNCDCVVTPDARVFNCSVITSACFSAAHQSLALPNHLVAFARNVDGDLLVLDSGAVREWSSASGPGVRPEHVPPLSRTCTQMSCLQAVLLRLPSGFFWSDSAMAFLRVNARCSTIASSNRREKNYVFMLLCRDAKRSFACRLNTNSNSLLKI